MRNKDFFVIIFSMIFLGVALITLYNSYPPKTSLGIGSYTLYGRTNNAFKLKYNVTLEHDLDEYTLNQIKNYFNKTSLKYSSDSITYFENDFINYMSEQKVRVISINRCIN